MSDVAEACGEARAGPAVRRLPPTGMITVRGDLAGEPLARALADLTGCAVPGRRRIETTGETTIAWMAPDELMLFLPHAAATGTAARLDAALEGQHRLVADVSDARALFRVSGPGGREVLAKGAPIDLAPDAFGPGDIRRTRLGQVAAAIWMPTPGELDLMCFRSVADFVETWLIGAASPGSLPRFLEK
jgi:sarcosine oxidase subunit gamma